MNRLDAVLFVLSSRCLSGWKRTDKVLYLSLTSSTEAVSGRLRTELKLRQKGRSWDEELTNYRKPSCSIALPSLADWLMRCRCENKVKRASTVRCAVFRECPNLSSRDIFHHGNVRWSIALEYLHHGRSTKRQASLFTAQYIYGEPLGHKVQSLPLEI